MKPRVLVTWRRVDDTANEPLAPAEAALLSSAALPKRRAEFVAGRAAARAAVAQLLGLSPDEIAILRESGDSDGRPYAARRDDGARLDVALSITHADGLALAAAAHVPLGIDVVAHERLPAAFVDEAFAPGELDGWRGAVDDGSDAAATVCTAFAAKEAALKWLGCGMRVPLRSVVVAPLGPPSEAGPFRRLPVRVRAETLDGDHVLSAWFGEHDRRIWMLLAATDLPPVSGQR